MSRRGPYSVTRFLALGFVALVAAVWLDSRYRPSWLFVDWTGTEAVPFAVNDQLEIASRWYPLKRSSMSLLCGRDGVHLMMKSRLSMPDFIRDGVSPSADYTSHTEIVLDWVRIPGGVEGHSFQTKSAMVQFGPVDTVVTAPLARQDQAMLVNWYVRGAPQGMFFAVFESGAKLGSVTDLHSVSTFLRNCPS